MKWDATKKGDEGVPLGRGCQRCSDSGDAECQCGSVSACQGADKCKCALAGKCCKCCCKEKCNNGCAGEKAKCICDKEKQQGKENGGNTYDEEHRIHSYTSAYPYKPILIKDSYVESKRVDVKPYWKDLTDLPDYYPGSASSRRHHCAQILLGSVCLIWSGLTYMYWTGKWAKGSPRWNNHILDGSGLDDGTLSQWLQALGFPKEMLNNSGPGNRLDAVIWDGIRGMLYLGFPETGNGGNAHGHDNNDNTFRNPAGMNYAGYIHTVDRGAFCSNATVFHKNGTDATITEENINKCGALYKLYILSCAYFTGLQKKAPPKADNKTPRTIREILYWLSALPYSQAYKGLLEHGKDRLKEVTKHNLQYLSFYQTGLKHPITVHEFNLFAHFQAVTQYCPLVLIGIQGGLGKSTDSTKEPPIHSLYANTHFSFTYPAVDIQAYNQVVHYIRALFYQLYFLRKQCAVKVTCGGKWRECRYGKDVESKGVVSWMCLGCNPMEHDRNYRVDKVKGELDGVKGGDAEKLKDLLQRIGDVVVQLGNAQEALEGKKKEAIQGVKKKLSEAKTGLEKVKDMDGLNGELTKAKTALEALTNGGGKESGSIDSVTGNEGLDKAKDGKTVDPGKNRISEVIRKVLDVLGEIQKELENNDSTINGKLPDWVRDVFTKAIKQLLFICNSPKCPTCDKHSTKCGKPSKPDICRTCLQPTTTGVPSPLQAFLEDRLPGFSCRSAMEALDKWEECKSGSTPSSDEYPPAASHLGHCGGSGQCCPLPMGFRGHFHSGSTGNMTGSRLYGILYFFCNENMMQSCVYTLVRVTAELSATTPRVLGDVFGFFRGGVGNKEKGKPPKGGRESECGHIGLPSDKAHKDKYFCGWCASGLREEVQSIQWIPNDCASDKTSVTTACSTEVIGRLIELLALGLQKWVGWQDGDKCCLKGTGGIGGKCKHGDAASSGANSCNKDGTPSGGSSGGSTRGGTPCASHDCDHCGVKPKCTSCSGNTNNKCYLSAYCKNGGTGTDYLWPTLSDKPVQLHLLARIFLGSVCLIWSGLSQLGFLTGGSTRWKESKLHEVENGLGSFMAAMGYDLERLNGICSEIRCIEIRYE